MLLCQLFLEKLCLGLLFQFSFKNSTVLPTESVLFSFTLLSSNSLLFLELGDSGIGQFFEFLVVGLRYDLPHSGPVWWHFSWFLCLGMLVGLGFFIESLNVLFFGALKSLGSSTADVHLFLLL